MIEPDAERLLTLAVPVDVALTLRPLQRGVGDPTVRALPEGVWLTRREPAVRHERGLAATMLVSPAVTLPEGEGWQVRVRAWGPGAASAVAGAERLLGLVDDGWPPFDDLVEPTSCRAAGRAELPEHVRRVRRTRPGLRLPAAGALATQLMTVVLEQKVTNDQARHGWRVMVRLAAAHDGDRAPGPAPEGMLLPPTPHAVRRIPSWDWHQKAWVQPSQSRTVLEVARRAETLDRLGAGVAPGDTAGIARLAEQLQSIPGIGPWTAAEALQRSHGAADLVSVGDFHLAHHVGQVLTGERTDDAGMMRLLEPWKGHRHRVVRLVALSGERMERRGPRLAPADHRGR